MASLLIDDHPGSKELLLSYCKRVLSEITTQQEQSQDNSQKGIILNVYHDKCLSLIKEISSLNPETFSYVVLSNTLQKISQLVLDFTYVEECCLVDQDFLLQAAYERVTYIVEVLSGVESLTSRAAPDNNPQDMLSPSLLECIHWRKGALLYMYCHTLNSRCSREKLPAHFLECLQNGSKHLVAMLSTRNIPLWLNTASDGTSEPDIFGPDTSYEDGDILLSQGIYSDTHLLALMYLGEMCYWYAQLTQSVSHYIDEGGRLGDNDATTDAVPRPDTQSRDHQTDVTTLSSPSPKDQGETSCLVRCSSNNGDLACPQSMPLQTTTASPSCDRLEQGQTLDLLRVGQLCLKNYVSAAKGPMSAGGWNTDRAEEILQYFGKLSI